MKIKDLENKSIAELQKELIDKRNLLQKTNIELSTKKLKNFNKIKSIKKNIARILTIISEKKYLEKIDLNKKIIRIKNG